MGAEVEADVGENGEVPKLLPEPTHLEQPLGHNDDPPTLSF